MRERWARTTPMVPLDRGRAEVLLAPALAGARVLRLEPLTGGLTNSNYRVTLADAPHDVLIRFYQRDPKEAKKERALARLVASRVPVPQFLHLDADAETPYAVLEWVDGAMLEALVPALDERSLADTGRAVGRTLAAIHSFVFGCAGFFDETLEIMPFTGAFKMSAFLAECLIDGPGAAHVGSALARRVVDHATAHERNLARWEAPPRLTHFDFNGSNILMRQENGRWAVAAVLDWEFAASASPANDFGNLLRPPLGERRGFAESMADGYREAGGELPEDWRALARLADLTAWAEFLTRPGIGPDVVADARATFEAAVS